MEPFEDPTPEGAKEIATAMKISVGDILDQGQDWEYIFPSLTDLPVYERIYSSDGTSDVAKRVLGCFIFECLEDYLRGGGEESVVREALSRLAKDYYIHRYEFSDWSLQGDDHYDRNPSDGWHIMMLVRDFTTDAELSDADGSPTATTDL